MPDPNTTQSGTQSGRSAGWVTWPNLLTLTRLFGSPLVILMALGVGEPSIWIAVFVGLLVLTEWLDGLLARLFHQETALGARLDTIADAVFYACMIVTLMLIDPQLIDSLSGWIAGAVASYGVSWLASWLKFRQLPSYHTLAAKGAWVFIGLGLVSYFGGWGLWPLRLALGFVMAANVESVLITTLLPAARVNVPTLWHALRRVRAPDQKAGQPSSARDRSDAD